MSVDTPMSPGNAERVVVGWLDRAPETPTGCTWGVPWPRGTVPADAAFALNGDDGREIPVQSWPMARWPDGSLKWSAHAAVTSASGHVLRVATRPTPAVTSVRVDGSDDAVTVDTGAAVYRLSRTCAAMVESIRVGDVEVARRGRLVCVREQRHVDGEATTIRHESFTGHVAAVTVEQSGPVRAVVRVEGRHASAAGRAWLPFTLRLYFYAGLADVRIVHTFVYDGDAEVDFIRGLGLSVDVPLRDDAHNRHVRFAGEGDGVWGEPLRPLPVFRGGAHLPDLHDLYRRQTAGEPVPPLAEMPAAARTRTEALAAWDAFELTQLSADSYAVRKRTDARCAWVDAAFGRRATGAAFVGDCGGGLAIGLHDFWQSYPSGLAVTGATTDAATLTAWLWSPSAEAMDLRHYATRNHGLADAYEDVQPGFSTPVGVARTSELLVRPHASVPTRTAFASFASTVADPPRLVCEPAWYHATDTLGVWSPADRSTPARAWLEDRLDAVVDFMAREVEQRHWYGFWNYGDLMHSYDAARHCWRYDVGGFAWANTELTPDLALWYAFLRTGRADRFRFAMAMTRHTSEVDVHHLGRFAGLGSRHNVSHWGCGAKEVRISQAFLKRIFYYLTADERAGDLMREVLDVDEKLVDVDPMRLIRPKNEGGCPTHARSGPDWLALAGNWLVEWERTGDAQWRDRILAGVDSLAAMPNRLYSGPDLGYDPATKRLTHLGGDFTGSYHMMTLFGGAEVGYELTALLDSPAWRSMWLAYCEAYLAPPDRKAKVVGRDFDPQGYPPDFTRLTAFAAHALNDADLARHAWHVFFTGGHRWANGVDFTPTRLTGPAVHRPVDELPGISCNAFSQWCLNAIQNLALVGEHLPDPLP